MILIVRDDEVFAIAGRGILSLEVDPLDSAPPPARPPPDCTRILKSASLLPIVSPLPPRVNPHPGDGFAPHTDRRGLSDAEVALGIEPRGPVEPHEDCGGGERL